MIINLILVVGFASACFTVWMSACLPLSLAPYPLKDKYNPIITVILIIILSYYYLLIASHPHLLPSCLHSQGCRMRRDTRGAATQSAPHMKPVTPHGLRHIHTQPVHLSHYISFSLSSLQNNRKMEKSATARRTTVKSLRASSFKVAKATITHMHVCVLVGKFVPVHIYIW